MYYKKYNEIIIGDINTTLPQFAGGSDVQGTLAASTSGAAFVRVIAWRIA